MPVDPSEQRPAAVQDPEHADTIDRTRQASATQGDPETAARVRRRHSTAGERAQVAGRSPASVQDPTGANTITGTGLLPAARDPETAALVRRRNMTPAEREQLRQQGPGVTPDGEPPNPGLGPNEGAGGGALPDPRRTPPALRDGLLTADEAQQLTQRELQRALQREDVQTTADARRAMREQRQQQEQEPRVGSDVNVPDRPIPAPVEDAEAAGPGVGPNAAIRNADGEPGAGGGQDITVPPGADVLAVQGGSGPGQRFPLTGSGLARARDRAEAVGGEVVPKDTDPALDGDEFGDSPANLPGPAGDTVGDTDGDDGAQPSAPPSLAPGSPTFRSADAAGPRLGEQATAAGRATIAALQEPPEPGTNQLAPTTTGGAADRPDVATARVGEAQQPVARSQLGDAPQPVTDTPANALAPTTTGGPVPGRESLGAFDLPEVATRERAATAGVSDPGGTAASRTLPTPLPAAVRSEGERAAGLTGAGTLQVALTPSEAARARRAFASMVRPLEADSGGASGAAGQQSLGTELMRQQERAGRERFGDTEGTLFGTVGAVAPGDEGGEAVLEETARRAQRAGGELGRGTGLTIETTLDLAGVVGGDRSDVLQPGPIRSGRGEGLAFTAPSEADTELGRLAATTGERLGAGAAGLLPGAALVAEEGLEFGASVAAARAAGRAGTAGLARVRTAGATEIDLEDVTTEATAQRFTRGEPDPPEGEFPSDETGRYLEDAAEAFREQAERDTPEPVAERLEDVGPDEGVVAKKALELEPEGPGTGARAGTGLRTQAGDFESPGAFVGPSLSPYFARIEERASRSLDIIPSTPTIDRPTGLLVKTDVEEGAGADLETFAEDILDRAGETTIRTRTQHANRPNPGRPMWMKSNKFKME